jgi:hypothetical protein
VTAIKDSAIGYTKEMPEEKHPLEISSTEELYRKLDKGLSDIENGRVRPFDDVMDEIMDNLQKRIDVI